MSSYRQPKGTYTRGTGDWFSRFGAIASGRDNPGGPAVFGLYNDDPVGNAFYITRITLSVEIQDELFVSMGLGPGNTLFTSPLAGVQPSNPLLPKPSGQFYKDASNVDSGKLIIQVADALMFLDYPQTTEAPICIVPPGWSLLLGNGGAANEFWASVFYLVLPI